MNKIEALWRDLMDNKSDPRVANFVLMSSPLPTILICLSYVYLVRILLPKFMENRKPYKLKHTLIVYNFVQALFSLLLFLEEGRTSWFQHYSWRCQPIDYSRDELAMRMVHGSYLYYLSKFSEFFDTFFFILRKKNDQVSSLHVIHHGIMPFSVWWGVKFMPGGHSTFFGFLNLFVHTIMYTYYMLAAMGPRVQKFLWWKKYLTLLQMAQFVAIFVHSFQLFFHNPCNFPIVFSYWIGGHGVLFLLLFVNFYKRAYLKRNSRQPKEINIEYKNGEVESKKIH